MLVLYMSLLVFELSQEKVDVSVLLRINVPFY